MTQLDERTPLHRLTGTHPGRWDEESLDHPTDSNRPPGEPGHPVTPTPAWLSEPCGSVSLWHERLVPERFRGTGWDPGPRGVLVIAALGLFAILLAAYVSLRETPVSQPVPPLAALTETVPAEPGAPPVEGAVVPSGAATPVPGPVSVPVPATPTPAAAVPAGRSPLAPNATAAPQGAAIPGELVVSGVGLVEHGGLRRFPLGARVADALRSASPRPEADISTLNLAQPLVDGDQIIVARANPRPTAQQSGTTVVNSSHPASNSPAAPGPARTTGPPAKVNLNTATESDLDTLPGVGPVTAKAILAWRTRHGRFTSIDQLAEIQGIGHSRLNRLRERVTI
ncbi:ComEA family DNA-binding protein [Nocardia seriolae]|uniref:ComEA family DNA-binding protein n=1 Tax=Nocardia seriolae TaxID=37332 RepID=UPI0015E6459F|nr:ComEA family DNA-binding protein [Nocardia seriolae]QOW33801.1 helix-hairpin-helix domain-containing protein [Nocardia seriolae]QUN14927.1 helix-hairpin-helix domain-containing protein [Nocardia seriolae]WNJ60993.1 helix-hairpin-helix domain-containing protein [Nocardia seriolae]